MKNTKPNKSEMIESANASELKPLLCGEFDNGKEQRLYEIAKKYHNACDKFDETACFVRNERGVSMPVNREECVSINRNALRVKRMLISDNSDLEPIEIQRAISNYRE